MVRINLVPPENLADQHLIAEYNEILMLFGQIKNLKGKTPEKYCLGKGHILFFKNKLKYLKKRHETIKAEMRKRGFRAEKTIDLGRFDKKLANDWSPRPEDISTITKIHAQAYLRTKVRSFTAFALTVNF